MRNRSSVKNGLKKCNICREAKEVEENFYLNSANDCYSSCCKKCEAERKKKFKEALPPDKKEEFLARQRQAYHRGRNKQLLIRYKQYDRKKDFDCDVDILFIDNQLSKACLYCGFASTGLDRLDNSKGHTKDNCVPCCWECNTARMDNFSHEEMKLIGATIRQIKLSRQINLH